MFDIQAFREPGSEYRVHPFWFWNGEMQDEQIRLQIGEMAEKGVGGFFVCARQGLKVPYLSEAWFGKVRTAVEAAREYGLNVWLYDEYPYPSGIAGGEVVLEHPGAKHCSLVCSTERAAGGQRVELELPWARIVYAKAVPIGAGGERLWHQAVDVRRRIGNCQTEPIFQKAGLTAYNQKRFFSYHTVQKLDWTAPAGEWEIIIAQEQELEDFKYYGTFVDPCNREAMATFIRLTHERYAEHLSEYFGNTIKGMFTDEIGLIGKLPWSPRLAESFKERNGYDLRDHMEALFFAEAPQAPKIRYDYFQTVHELLLASYHKQVHDWCESRGLQYVTEVPSVRATTQIYSHVPGGDTAHEKLGRSLDWILERNAVNFRSNPKMVSSVARQLGRKRNLIECFHSVGWSMTLQDARWMIDRMAAFGTNFFNFHAFFYTLDGLVKHDAPPSQFLQNPYWKHFRKLGDYIGRICYAMSTGAADISIAVVQPTTSLWTHLGNPLHGFGYGGEDRTEKGKLEELKRWWGGICNGLSRNGTEFDHLDAELLGQAALEGRELVLGDARYSILILPPLANLEEAAWAKLTSFVRSGGTVVSLGQLPYEQIGSLPHSPGEVRRIFGLPEEGEPSFWSSAGGGGAASSEPVWSKGSGEAYHLAFPAFADMQDAMKALLELLNRLHPPKVELLPAADDLGLLRQTRRLGPDAALFFVSNQEGAARETVLRVSPEFWEAAGGECPLPVSFTRLSLDDGSEERLQAEWNDGWWTLPLQLAPYTSQLVLFRLAAGEEQVPPDNEGSRPWSLEVDASMNWRMRPLESNALRLDVFRMRVSRGQGAPLLEGRQVPVKTFIDQCADLAADALLPVSLSQMFGTPLRLAMDYPLAVVYSTEVDIRGAAGDVRLVMDQGAISGARTIRINGRVLDQSLFHSMPLYDHMNTGCDITAYLREGINTIAVDVEVGHDWDGVVDALYLTGSFQVEHDGSRAVLTEAEAAGQPAVLKAGPYPGHPFYAGDMSFARTVWLDAIPEADSFELVFAKADSEFHDCAEVLVNGHSLGARAWLPYKWQGPAEWLRQGENQIEVRVATTLIGLLEGRYFDYAAHAARPVFGDGEPVR
ncbi:MAG: hypothetical protein K0R57_5846 [Paenibacillaceae bacterium]|jgi:hypothetical protein|nr:hypothetical protein [Paenibacillaceae bacterium]